MIDDSSVTDGNLAWLGGTTSLQNPLNLAMERSLSQHDVAHHFVATGDWQIPFGRGRHFGSGVNRVIDAFIGGWEVSGFFTLQSGFPLQVNQSNGVLVPRDISVGVVRTRSRSNDEENKQPARA